MTVINQTTDRFPPTENERQNTTEGSKPFEKKDEYLFTIFIPTFNRAHTLPTALESINNQSMRDFEVVVIDDGSTDGTAELIRSWQNHADFPIKYLYQENRGKPSAHNRALELSEGTFFITLDSDDSMLPYALENVLKYWELIPVGERNGFAGVGALCMWDNGQISGTPYPEDIMDSNYLEVSRDHSLRGEKREAIRTDVLREFPYPLIEGEKHIRPSMILRRMSLKYRIRFINVPLQINRHAPDGIMSNRFEYRIKNPKGLRLCFYEEINLFDDYSNWKKLYRNSVRYIRYSLHSGIGILGQAREVKHIFTWIIALPEGISDWIVDLFRKMMKSF
jgi:glycosyltransferase involved in cell wall biosynthesis